MDLGEVIRFNQPSQSSSVNPLAAVAFSQSVAVGDSVMVGIQAPSTTAETTFTFTDTAGNTYVQRKVQAYSTPLNNQIAIFECKVTTSPIVAGTTRWTATSVNRNPAGWVVLGRAFDNTDVGMDLTAGAAGSFGASHDPATGSTSTASQDLEMLFVAIGFIDTGSANVVTLPSGWDGSAKETTVLTAPKSLILAWKLVNTPGARSFTGTGALSVSANWTAAIVPLKATPDPLPPSGIKLLVTSAPVLAEATLL